MLAHRVDPASPVRRSVCAVSRPIDNPASRGPVTFRELLLRAARTSRLAPACACVYVATAALPIDWDIWLIGLIVAAVTLVVSPRAPTPVTVRHAAVLFFAGVTGLAIALSPARDEIARLSVALLPATLLFFVIANGFRGISDTRALYETLSVTALGLCAWLSWNAWLDGPVSANTWMRHASIPLFVVGNDVTFFAVVAPLSAACLWTARTTLDRAVSALSLVSAVVVIVLFESRGALVTVAVTLGCFVAPLRPRVAVGLASVFVAVYLATDAALGFALLEKFAGAESIGADGGRFDLWRTAWSAFVGSPWIGHGPHSVWYETAQAAGRVRWAHNLYLDVLVGQGLLGFAAFFLVSAYALNDGRRTHQRESDGRARILNGAAVSAFIGLLVAGIWELSFLRLWVVLLFFALVAVITNMHALSHVSRPGERKKAYTRLQKRVGHAGSVTTR